MKKLQIELENDLSSSVEAELSSILELTKKNNALNPLLENTLKLLFKHGYFNKVIDIGNQLDTSISTTNTKEISYIKTLSLLELDQLDEMIFEMHKYGMMTKETSDSLYKTIKKNILLPQILQALIPGSGYVYEGLYGKGIVSLFINTAFTLSTIHYIRLGMYATSIVFGVLPFTKFYFGGQRNLTYLLNNRTEKIKKLNRIKIQIIARWYGLH